MRGFNRVLILGNLGADPEMRYTADGRALTTFRVAVNRSWTDASGERKQDVEWFRVVAWQKLGEFCHRSMAKGARVFVEGRLQTRSWDGPDGTRKYITEVVAREVVLLDWKSEPPAEALPPVPDGAIEDSVLGEGGDLPF